MRQILLLGGLDYHGFHPELVDAAARAAWEDLTVVAWAEQPSEYRAAFSDTIVKALCAAQQYIMTHPEVRAEEQAITAALHPTENN